MGCAGTFIDRVTLKPTGFVCGEAIEPCAVCGIVAGYLCDYPVGDGKRCDLPLCERHRICQGGDLLDIDFCPAHSIIARGQVRVEEQG